MFRVGGKAEYEAESKRTKWPAGSWYHLACTYDRENLKLYVNGREEGSEEMLNEDIMTPRRGGSFSIGWVTIGVTIDEVKYYDEALTAEQIMDEFMVAVEPQDKLTSTWASMKSK